MANELKLKKLHEAATAGPWEKNRGNYNVIAPNESVPDSYHVFSADGHDYERMTNNIELIAYLRNNAQNFVALIEAAEDAKNCSDDRGIIRQLIAALAPFAE